MSNEQPKLSENDPSLQSQDQPTERRAGQKPKSKNGLVIALEAVGGLLLTIGLSSNGWISLLFTVAGLIGCALGLRIQLQNYKYKMTTASNWALLFFALGVVGWFAMKSDELRKPVSNSHSEEKDIRQEIRSFFESVDPGILKAMDAGEKSLIVMLNAKEEFRLHNLELSQEYSKYIEYSHPFGNEASITGEERGSVLIAGRQPFRSQGSAKRKIYVFDAKDALRK